MRLITRFILWIVTFVLSLVLVVLGIVMFVVDTDWKGIMADYVLVVKAPFMSLPSEELPTESIVSTEPTTPEEPIEPTDPVEPN